MESGERKGMMEKGEEGWREKRQNRRLLGNVVTE